MKYLGIDYGTKRIGLSIGSSETKIALVFGTVKNTDEVADVVRGEDIDVVVAGAPYSVANVAHELPEAFTKFINELRGKLPGGVAVELADERLSSKYADSLSGNAKAKAGRDEIAAVAILQGYLDKMSAKI